MSIHYQIKPRSTHIDYASVLNAEQYQAVTAPPAPMLVIAGAGSGKTRTLTYRVAYLIEHGVAPHRILLLTFTNKASKEMLQRVSELLPEDISRIWGGTFHHVGNRILRRHIPLLGEWTQDFSILDREDAVGLMKSCIQEAGIKDKSFPKPDVVLEALSLSRNMQVSLAVLLEKQMSYLNEFLPRFEELYRLYQHKKLRANAVDFDDLLELPVQLFERHPELIARFGFEHILVDEYQDTNLLQARLIDQLGAEHHRIMAVGDDAQSIYSWRGANFANMMSFTERHPNTQVLFLKTNYRSVPEILNLANSSIAQNAGQFAKDLHATRSAGVKPALVALHDAHQQASFIAQRVGELIDEGVEPKEIAVLYRSHFHAMELQMELSRQGVPYQMTSGVRFFEQAHIKDVAAHLRLVANPQDETAFRRLALMLPGVGDKTASKLWSQGIESARVPEKSKPAWEQWKQTHEQLQHADFINRPADLIQMILDAYYLDYLRLHHTNYNQRLEDLRQLQVMAQEYESTSDFLAQLSLLTSTDTETDSTRDGLQIRLSTVHQAKGLEFQVVFVMMLCDGYFPSNKSLETPQGEEEERRLFYVAVTRAKDELYLTYPQQRFIGNQGDVFLAPSRFLDEFPRTLCNVWKVEAPLNSGGFSGRWV